MIRNWFPTPAEVGKHIEPGIETGKLDMIAEDLLRNMSKTCFKGYGSASNPFPGTLCISVNEEVVHGIPGKRVLNEGDIVSIDCGVELNGYYGDHAYTFAVGECSDETWCLLKTTLESLYKGIEQAIHGNRIGDIGNAVQTHCEVEGYGVVRDLLDMD